MSFKQINNIYVNILPKKVLGPWVVNGGEVTMVVYATFSVLNSLWLVISMLYLLVLGGYTSHGTFISVFREEGQGGEGQCYLPTSTIFINSFSLRYLICQGAMFEDSMP